MPLSDPGSSPSTKLNPGALCAREEYCVVQENALDFLPRLEPHSVDLIFADPPYFLSNNGTTCRSGRRVSVNKGHWDTSRGVVADHEFNRRWLEECQRVLKPSGTIWVSGTQHVIFSLGFAMQQLGFHFLNTITWYKPNASPNLACRTFTHSTEILIWAAPERGPRLLHTFHYHEMRAQAGGRQMRDLWPLPDGEGCHLVWTIPTPPKREKSEGQHPTQKPLELLDRIVVSASSPGDLILDPFAGSATTGVAAVRRGRRFLGVEISSDYVALAGRRLQAAREAMATPLQRTVSRHRLKSATNPCIYCAAKASDGEP
jgi:site-specific DNA-methyltransferase (adenine-specific)